MTHAAAEASDYVVSPVPGASSAQTPGATSKFKFMFSAPAKWPGPLRWYYNHAGAPVQLGAKEDVIQQIVTQSAKWSAVCGIPIEYGGETDAVPKTLAGGPDGISVVGWQKPGAGIDAVMAAVTYVWYQSHDPNVLTLVESDMMLDLTLVTASDQMTRAVVHEWGHAIGLGHSNVEGALMSGPPDSMYTGGTDLTADDVHGCRCLYGPAAGQQAGNVCSLPEVIDFGTIAVGSTSSESQVRVTNSGNAALVMSDIQTGSNEFLVGTNGCMPGYSLAPGASCTFGVLARLALAGERSGEVTINTSEGPYRIPLEATGAGAPPNFEGSWWNAPAGSESGWGINLAHQGDVIFATWFTYDATGRAWWLSMTANRTGNGVYSGMLFETHGPAFNATPFDPNAVWYFPVGAATLTFSDENNGTFAYTVNGIAQTKAITRMVFGTLPRCTFGMQGNLATATANYQDIWWTGTGESGWGVHLTQQSDLIFATWFTYDFDGAPLWLSATASKTSAGVYSGTLFRTTGPAFSAVPFDPLNVVRTPVGTLTLTFRDGDNATFAYAMALGNPPVSVVQTKQVTRQVFQPPGTVCQ
jgi:hypothetical protein